MRKVIFVGAATGFGQMLSYGLVVIGAKILTPADFGLLSTLLILVFWANVLAISLQLVTARRLADIGAHAPGFPTIVKVAVLSGAALSAVLLISSPILAPVLRLNSVLDLVVLSLLFVPLTLLGVFLGAAQGKELFGRFSLITVASTLGRSGGAIVGLVVSGSVLGAVSGMVIGTWAGFVISWLLTPRMQQGVAVASRVIWTDFAQTSHALIALYILTGMDVILARALLPAAESGQFAVGAILTKICFWLPSFALAILFPNFVRSETSKTLLRATVLFTAVGLAMIAACWIMPQQIILVISQAEYLNLAPILWVFALAGSSYAVVQLQLYAQMAKANAAAIAILWVSCVLLLVISLWRHSTVGQLAANVAAVAVLAAIAATIYNFQAQLRKQPTPSGSR